MIPRWHPQRASVEACIAEIYERIFAARRLCFPGLLVALVDASGRPLCAAGLRTAADGFFSEAYLDVPIDSLLTERAGRPVARATIFEVTTLASRSATASPGFICRLAALGKTAGFQWAFFTATARLRALLAHIGLAAIELAPAQRDRVVDPANWGSYYTNRPKVCAVDGDCQDSAILSARGPTHA